jgi:hypothetical protein
VLKFTDRDVHATVGVTKSWEGDNFIINQMYSKRNKSVDQCHHDFVNEWLVRPDVQQWFKDNYKVTELACPPELVEINF